MKRTYCIAILFALLCCALPAQEHISNIKESSTKPSFNCPSDALFKAVLESDEAFRLINEKFEKAYRKEMQSPGSTAIMRGPSDACPSSDQILTIPVVIHVVHEGRALGSTENPSLATLESYISGANSLLRHTSGASFTNPFSGIDTKIELCLATRDPGGLATDGVTRHNVSDADMEANSAGAGAYPYDWDKSSYMNMYILESISSTGEAIGGVWIFDTLNDLDAIYLSAPDITFNAGLIVHEVGHYFSLRHVFDGCTNNNCLQDGDLVCDTPPKNVFGTGGQSCSNPTNSCVTDDDDLDVRNPYRPVASGGIGDQPDMFENYMDYTGICWAAFSQGQSARMRFNILGQRSSLLVSEGCLPFSNLDASVIAVSGTDNVVCSGSTAPVVTIMNNGSATLTSLNINVELDGINVQSFPWTGSLATGATTTVTLNPISYSSGTHNIFVYSSSPNGGQDQYTVNDDICRDFSFNSPESSLEYCETSESGSLDSRWVINNPDSDVTFEVTSNSSCTANNGNDAIYINTWDLFLESNFVDELISPVFDLSAYSTASLSFDRAYSASYLNYSTLLDVGVSGDCGLSWTSVYSASDDTGLPTVFAPNIASEWAPSTCNDWETVTRNLDSYAGGTLLVRFRVSTNEDYLGQPLYLDNICVDGTFVGVTCNATAGTVNAASTDECPLGGVSGLSTSYVPASSDPGASYTNAYVLTDGTSTNVLDVSTSGTSFSGLPAGDYCVHSMSLLTSDLGSLVTPSFPTTLSNYETVNSTICLEVSPTCSYSFNVSDDDADSDTVVDCLDNCPNTPNTDQTIPTWYADTDNDGAGDAADTQSSCTQPAGYVANSTDLCPTDGNKTVPGDCGCGNADTDSDSDGTADCIDGCPDDPNKTTAGLCGCGVADTDTDSDDTPDCLDNCPNDPNKTEPGACGCGFAEGSCADCAGVPGGTAFTDGCGTCVGGTTGLTADTTDTDDDGTLDCNDDCPNDPNKITPGVCGCGTADTDTDSDGTPDCNDNCPDDPNKTEPGACGCGIAEGSCGSDCNGTPGGTAFIDGCGTCVGGTTGLTADTTDSDDDGTLDCNDGCPNDANKTEAGECGCGVADTDSDSDGTADCNDGCPNDANKTEPGACGCGVAEGTCSDCNGTPGGTAFIDGCGTCVGGTTGQTADTTDTDDDGTLDCNDGCPDDPNKIVPGDCGCGVAEGSCTDCAGVSGGTAFLDGCGTCVEGTTGQTADTTDSDDDGTLDCNDGCPNDANKTEAGICGCGIADTDSDSDGTADCNDGCPNDADKTAPGECGCGVADTDSDNDSTADCNDNCPNDPNKTEPGDCGCGAAEGSCNDCAGVSGGTAFVDGCGTCVGGTTGLTADTTDSDLDGTLDCNDDCPDDANKTEPGICGCGSADTDSDSDGTADCNDGCPDDPNKTQPGECGCGFVEGNCSDCAGVVNGAAFFDDCGNCVGGTTGEEPFTTDSDGDGTVDCNDLCPLDPNKIQPGVCGCGSSDVDSDNDDVADCNDACPQDPNKTQPGQCGCGNSDADSDADGTADCNDGCPDDAAKVEPGICGCGESDTADADSDGSVDCIDGCPDDPNKTDPGACGCGIAEGTCQDCNGVDNGTAFVDGCGTCVGGDTGLEADTSDSDSDGTLDCNDGCPDDPGKTEPGLCGCGSSDADSDNDGTADCDDGCPDDPNKTDPGVCGCGFEEGDCADCAGVPAGSAFFDDCGSCVGGTTGLEPNTVDTDNDGTLDCDDGCPEDADKTEPGICGCGTADTDTDQDSVADCEDNCPFDANKTEPGVCGCGVADDDADNDGTANCIDECPGDPNKTEPGQCGCGQEEGTCGDCNGDDNGTAFIDDCGDCVGGNTGLEPNSVDSDADGTPNCIDECPFDANKTEAGDCGCGQPDTDSNNNNIADCLELPEQGAVAGSVWIDANENGVQDDEEDGYEGLLVTLTNFPDNEIIQLAETDADGNYTFNDVEPGYYKVIIETVPGFEFAAGGDVDANGNTLVFQVTGSGETLLYSGGLVTEAECPEFSVDVNEICLDSQGEFIVVISLAGGNDQGYWISSTHDAGFNGVVFQSYTDGPFPIGTGFDYNISLVSNPECSQSIMAESIQCVTVAVELLSFEGRTLEDGNQLSWTTATEADNAFFTLQRSLDGINYESIARLQGAGNSNTATDYAYLDTEAPTGVAYYRLSETDMNGQEELCSQVITLVREGQQFEIATIYPIPVTDMVNVDLEVSTARDLHWVIYNASGQQVTQSSQKVDSGSSSLQIEVSDFAAGVYFLSMQDGQSQIVSKFVKR